MTVAVTVAVIGGGPAGLMAAERLASAGAPVTVFERMASVGRKFLLAGRGGLNLTHSEPLDRFLDRYGPARSALAPAVTAFDPDALRAWSASLGQVPFVGTSGRVFPAGLRATPLLRAWLRRLAEQGVEIRTGHTWQGWDAVTGALRFADAAGDEVCVPAEATVLALGGASWPRSGSNGAWVPVVEAAGIEVVPLRPANCGFTVSWSEPFTQAFAGTPVKDVRLNLGAASARGDAMVTATGIEGGAVYGIARELRDAIERDGPTVANLDLRPDLTVEHLAGRITGRGRDSLSSALRRAGLAPVAIGLLREATANQVPRDATARATLVKAVPITLLAPQPIERAISTAGGIAWAEVDEHLMLRRRPGTFVAGEMLDWEAPTGGYLLQATFSTAVTAADGALAWWRAGS